MASSFWPAAASIASPWSTCGSTHNGGRAECASQGLWYDADANCAPSAPAAETFQPRFPPRRPPAFVSVIRSIAAALGRWPARQLMPKRHFAAVNCCIAKAPHDAPAPVFKSVQNCSDSVLRRTHPESRAPLGEQEANIDQFIACLNIARYVDLLKAETDRTKRGLLQKLSVEEKDQTGPAALYGHG